MVAIKDFEMPKSCAECRLSFADVCPITGKTQVVNVINDKMSSDCPLVEIKEREIIEDADSENN